MDASSLSYHLAFDRQCELLAQAERSRGLRLGLRRGVAGTAKPRSGRRRALRRALLGAPGRPNPQRG
jgi:hypothetical protein